MPRSPSNPSGLGPISAEPEERAEGPVDSRDTFAPDTDTADRRLPSAGAIDRTHAVTPEASGRYEEVADGFIGEGGVGWVRAVRDLHLDRVVARKEVGVRWPGGRSGGSGPDKVDRFLREAKVTAQLEHPSIIPVYELGIGADGSQAEGDRIVLATDEGLVFVDDPDADGLWRRIGDLGAPPAALVARGDFVAAQTIEGHLRAWRLSSGERWLNSVGRPFSARNRQLALGPGGAQLAATRDTGELLVWSYVGGFGYRRPSVGLVGGTANFVATDNVDRGLVFPKAGLPRSWRTEADPPRRWSYNLGWRSPGMGVVISGDAQSLLAVSMRGDVTLRDAITGVGLESWGPGELVTNAQVTRGDDIMLAALSSHRASRGTSRTDQVQAPDGGTVYLVAVTGGGSKSDLWSYTAEDLCNSALAEAGAALVTLQRTVRLVRYAVGDGVERAFELDTPVSSTASLLLDANATQAVVADGTLIHRFDFEHGVLLPALHSAADVVAADVGDDGRQLVTVDKQARLEVWPHDGVAPAWSADVGGAVPQVALLASGAVLLRTESGNLELRDRNGLRWRKRGVAGTFVVSPDESMVATGASQRSSVGIRQIADGAMTQELWDERTWVMELSWSPDSRQVAVVNNEGYLQSFPVSHLDAPADFLRTGALTNLRACPDSLAVVPVAPYPLAATVWAPPESCSRVDGPAPAPERAATD